MFFGLSLVCFGVFESILGFVFWAESHRRQWWISSRPSWFQLLNVHSNEIMVSATITANIVRLKLWNKKYVSIGYATRIIGNRKNIIIAINDLTTLDHTTVPGFRLSPFDIFSGLLRNRGMWYCSVSKSFSISSMASFF